MIDYRRAKPLQAIEEMKEGRKEGKKERVAERYSLESQENLSRKG